MGLEPARSSDAPTVVVTGGCGFIGVNVGRHLKSAGYRAVAFDDFSTGLPEDAHAAGYDDVVEGDIRDAEGLAAAVRGATAVVHLAAHTGVVGSVEDPYHDSEVNIAGTLNALMAARDVGASAFVFASSGAPLGSVDPPGHEGLAARPLSPYGASKLAGEGYCSAFAGSYGLAATSLRFTNVYGPYSYHKGSVVALFMKLIMDGKPLVIYGDGSQTRDFLYIDDLCGAVLAVLERRPVGELYQLGTGTETSVSELVGHLVKLFPDREIDVRYEPARAGEIARSFSDISRAQAGLGYDPVTGLADGLARTRDWFVGAARRMRLRTGVLGVLAAVGIAAVVIERNADRARTRATDRKLGDLVRAHALALVPASDTVPYTDPTIAIVIAALDEEDAIGAVLDDLPRELCGYRVAPIVVVDGGTDDTAGVVQRAGYTAVRHELNRGQGDALVTGFQLAVERKAAIVVTMDADGQHEPAELPKLLAPILAGDADYVQGSRYLGEYDDAGGARDVGIRGFTALVNAASRAGITDCTNGFRAIRGESLAELRLEEPRFSAAELIIESARRGLRIQEVPVHIQSRSHGESKKPRRLGYPIGYLGAVVRTWRR